MRYRCEACGRVQVRGFFPVEAFHVRYAVFHGVALGVSSIVVKGVFAKVGFVAGGLASLGACLVVLLLIYGVSVVVEQVVVARRGCGGCGSRRLLMRG